MKTGIDYYPEQRSKSAIQRDAELMSKTGIKLVRMGEKSWCKFEPHNNNFCFEWFDEIISVFSRYGIGIVLRIPAGKPPQWLKQKAESICLNSPEILQHTSRFADEFTKHYSQNKAIAGVHIECNLDICNCKNCRSEFIQWLKDRYDNIANLNNAFGSIADGTEYTDWEQVAEEKEKSPSLKLAYYRFSSECRRKYINFQGAVVKKNMPKIPLEIFVEPETNFYYECNCMKYACIENFPQDDGFNNFRYDLSRGIADRNFIISQRFGKSIPRPNTLKGNAVQAFSHGADTIYYKWNTALSGSDMFDYGLIDHSGTPSRCFFEFSELCKMAMRLETISNTVIKSDIAVLYSPESEFAFGMHEDFTYRHQLMKYYSAFRKYGANVDIIDSKKDLSEYSLVIAPCLYVNDKTVTENIYRYVINGGTLVMTTRSGIKDSENKCIPEHLPTVFRELVGAEVTEYDRIAENQSISDYSGQIFECSEWCDILKLNTARAYAEYNNDYYMGCTAITLNDYCKGKVYYIGTVPDDNFCMDFVGKLMKYHGIPRLQGVPDGIEVTTRSGEKDGFIIFFNNSSESQSIELPKAMYSVIDSRGKQKIELSPYDADILRT